MARIEARLDRGDMPATLAVLAASTSEVGRADHAMPAKLAAFVTYVTEQAPQIPEYASRRQADWTIGSGTAEKGVDLVVNGRLKGKRGMQWRCGRVKGVPALRVAVLNDECEHFGGSACCRSHLPANRRFRRRVMKKP